jgi:hypothetical protein
MQCSRVGAPSARMGSRLNPRLLEGFLKTHALEAPPGITVGYRGIATLPGMSMNLERGSEGRQRAGRVVI